MAQLGGAAQHAVDKEAMRHDAAGAHGRGVADDDLVGHRAGKAAVPALGIEAKQVIAIGVGFADPQFAHDAAVGQKFLHFKLSSRRKALILRVSNPGDRLFPAIRLREGYMVQCSKIST